MSAIFSLLEVESPVNMILSHGLNHQLSHGEDKTASKQYNMKENHNATCNVFYKLYQQYLSCVITALICGNSVLYIHFTWQFCLYFFKEIFHKLTATQAEGKISDEKAGPDIDDIIDDTY